MVNKKILISCLLVLLVAISVSAVSAADDGDVLAATDDDCLAIGNIIYVDGDDDVAVSTAIDSASDGDIIELGDSGYTFNNGIEVTKSLTFHGDNATIYANGSAMPDGVFMVKADGAGTAFSGLSFINTDDADSYLYKYNGMLDNKGKSVKTSVGIAINLYSAADNVLIDNCYFLNWFNSAVGVNSANYATISNSQFYGGSATFINNLPDGPKDRGTYHISVMSSRGTTVDNCYFGSTVCDGVSVAGGSYDSTITNNIFENNAFSIYFGGKATEGTLIQGNTFINSGWFESPIYDENGTTGENISFQDLPVISVQKSSDSFVINNNTFYARNANMLIKALEGSTAHGGESNIGNITITDNTVLGMDKYDSTFEKVIMASVTLTYIETYNDVIRPIGEIKIANNKLNGARAAAYWTQKWGDDLGNVSISQAPIPTTIAISSLKDSTIKGTLKDFDGKGVGGGIISYVSAAVNGTVETAFDGAFTISGVSDIVNLTFTAFDNYKGSTASVEVAPTIPLRADTELLVDDMAITYNDGSELIATLVNVNTGNAIIGSEVVIDLNGVSNTLVTDSNGQVKVSTKGLLPGTYTAVVSYAGDVNFYNPTAVTADVAVYKGITAISAVDTGSELVVTLTNAATGKALTSANVVVTINGVATTYKTNSKGQVKVSTADLDPTYTAVISYAGNAKYASSTTTAKVVENLKMTSLSTAYDDETGEVVVTLKNAAGKALKGAKVSVTINGVKTSQFTDSNGQVRVAPGVSQGLCAVTSSYAGNTKYYAGTSTTESILVKD